MALCAVDGIVRYYENEQKRNIAQNIRQRSGKRIWSVSADAQQNQKLTITEAGGIVAAVLTAIAIPVFNTQLEKSRQATDLANLRAAYAEAMTNALNSDDGTGSATSVAMTSVDVDWGLLSDDVRMGTVAKADLPDTTKGSTVTINVAADGSVTFS